METRHIYQRDEQQSVNNKASKAAILPLIQPQIHEKQGRQQQNAHACIGKEPYGKQAKHTACAKRSIFGSRKHQHDTQQEAYKNIQ